MKKMILMMVTATMVLSLTACAGKTENTKNAQGINEAIPTTEISQSENQEVTKIQTYMGEVKDKVGNNITLSLGNFILENDGEAGQAMMVDENGNQVPVDGDLGDGGDGQVIMIPMPEDSDEEGDANASGDSEIEKLPIEFTGEVKDFVIPAGAKIVNAMGNEITLDSIAKGSLIQLIVNESSGVVETIMVL